MEKKYFTVDEANAVLRKIRPLIERMTETVQAVREWAEEIRPMIESAESNGGHPRGTEFVLIEKKLQDEIALIHACGCVLKDPGIGLLDFPSLRNGHEIELCWRLGEDDIRFWHEVGAGYANRQPL